MSGTRLRWGTAFVLGIAVIASVGAAAIGARPTEDRIARLADVAQGVSEGLGKDRQLLSSGGQQFLGLYRREEELRRLSRFDFAGGSSPRSGALGIPSIYANDVMAPEDFASRLMGMTQSETSNAWCGDNAVIGFNDAGSFIDTLTGGAPSLSFVGWAHSSDAGQTFSDQGPLVPQSSDPQTTELDLFGDPVTGCTSDQDFYFASLAFVIRNGNERSALAVARSTDGGATFPSAVTAVRKGAGGHFLDKEWMAVDPGPTGSAGDDRLYVVYTDFDFSGNAACGNQGRTAIELVRSTDGGDTWSSPQVISEVCGFRAVQGSQVDADGDVVHVAWEEYRDIAVSRRIWARTSTDGGQTFDPPVIVAGVTPVGEGFITQGGFRNFLDLQGLAIDRSGGPNDGNVYISFQDGRRVSQEDPGMAFLGAPGCTGNFNVPRYCFGDAYVVRSSTLGASWEPRVRVHPADGETDQFMPALEVDDAGQVLVLFYDRAGDPRNFLLEPALFTSVDGGQTWNPQPLAAGQPSPPITSWQDFLASPFYMGDYIGVAVDATGSLPGVLSSWGDMALGDQNVAYEAP